MVAKPLVLTLLALLSVAARAQAPSDVVYDHASVSRVDIAIDPDSLQWVFDNPLSDREVPADFAFTRGRLVETVPTVGFRLRGNTSRLARKHSFKVSFNTFGSRSWRGLEKLNLNGEHNDPTIARSVLAWDLFGELGVVGSRASHTELYVNGVYYGLYANVEHLDETFLQRRFGSEGGYLFKCLYPADLAYRGPTGADYQHTDGSGRPVYELSQGEPEAAAFDALARFIATLNQTSDAAFPAEIERVFDVNAFLEVLAADVAVGEWDAYWYNKNNYYLRFAPEAGRVTYVPYDYDNTFGIDFVDRDWGTRDPYTWGNNSEARPLVSRILAVPGFRDRYTFYLRQILAGPFAPATLHPQIDALEVLLTPYAEADTFRTLDYGYTIADFHDAFSEALGGHVEYGLKPFVTTRHGSLLAALDATNVAPIVHRPAVSPARPAPADALTFTATVEDEAALASVVLLTLVDAGDLVETAMRDDGTQGDAAAGDDVFTAILPAVGAEATVEYAVRATDAVAQVRTSPFRTVFVRAAVAGLVVNEFLASNSGAFPDPAGDAEDWVEIHNPTADAVSLAGYTLTDDLGEPDKWAFPDTTIAAGGFLLVWADDEPDEGLMHATIKLSAGGEAVGLFRAGVEVDAVTFGPQATDISTGRLPDGTGAFVAITSPTPGAPNTATAAEAPAEALTARAFPNPFRSALTVETGRPLPEGSDAVVFDALGRLIARLSSPAGATRLTWNASAVPAGVYVVRVRTGGDVWTATVVRW